MRILLTSLLLVFLTESVFLPAFVRAESLFRSSVSYTAAGQQFTPHSLYTQPRPRNIGDVLTINIQDSATMQYSTDMTTDKTQTINETGISKINNFLHNTLKVPTAISLPSFDGTDNANKTGMRGTANRQRTLTDSISCQVVQVLPNGYLVVQGKKTVGMNKERQDIFVSGIVNPYYIDRTNTISSNQVGNMSINVNSSGVLSRQTNDGLINKYYQFLN